MTMHHTVVPTPLGQVLMATDGQTLNGIWFEGQKHAPCTQGWQRQDNHPLLMQASQQVQSYLAGQSQAFDLPLNHHVGTEFQRRVWQQVMGISRGQVRTYADIARDLGRPRAARAVGAAVGRNPWLMVVPCHRVVGSGGQLTGYAAGLERKQSLLRMEGWMH